MGRFERIHPHASQHVFDKTDQLPPATGILRLYVDGTLGNDAASGTSWATAWKTADKLLVSLAAILFVEPNGLVIETFCRNTIAASDVFAGIRVVGTSRYYIGQHVDDFEVVRSGAVTAVGGEAPVPKHGLERLTVNVAGLDGTEVGCTLVVLDPVTGTNRGTSTILRVDSVNGYLWTSQLCGEYPVWVAASPANVSIRRPSAYITGGLVVNQQTVVSAEFPAACPYSTSAFIGLRSGGRMEFCGSGIAAIACYARNLALVWKNISWQEGHLQLSGYLRWGTAYGLPDTVATDFGLIGGPTPIQLNCVGNAGANEYIRTGSDVAIQGGYRSTSITLDGNGGYGDTSRFYSPTIYAASRNWIGCSNYMLSGTSSSSAHTATLGGLIKGNKFSLVIVPAAGIPAIYEATRRGFIRVSDANVEGNNTGANANRYVGWTQTDGMISFDGAVSEDLKAKTSCWRIDGGRIEFGSTWTCGSSEGAAADCYVGPDGTVSFGGTVTKSATNPAGGGTAKPFLQVARGGRAVQVTGGNFTLPAGSGDYPTDYGADGAIVAKGGLPDLRLGNLTGGTGATTGIGCTVKNGARLAHNGAGLSGVAPLDLGGLPAPIPWPAAAQTDAGAVIPQDCIVIPNVP